MSGQEREHRSVQHNWFDYPPIKKEWIPFSQLGIFYRCVVALFEMQRKITTAEILSLIHEAWTCTVSRA